MVFTHSPAAGGVDSSLPFPQVLGLGACVYIISGTRGFHPKVFLYQNIVKHTYKEVPWKGDFVSLFINVISNYIYNKTKLFVISVGFTIYAKIPRRNENHFTL